MVESQWDDIPWLVYQDLEKACNEPLLDAIDDAVDILEANPGSAEARRRSFGDGKWGIPIRARADDWLLIWEQDGEVPVVRYLGKDPFAQPA